MILNKYIAVPGLIKRYPELYERYDFFAVNISETLCVENLPDLWWIMRDIFRTTGYNRKKKCNRNMMHNLFAQALPCFHETSKNIQVDEYATVALNVLLGSLLGVYPNCMRKPHFTLKALLYERVHVLMTSTHEVQQAFFDNYPHLISLSCMEYIAFVTPLYWPAENELLIKENNMSLFFEKLIHLCDEVRMYENGIDWRQLEQQAESKIKKCCRTRKSNRVEPHTVCKRKHVYDVQKLLDCPVVGCGQLSLVAHAYQIPVNVLQDFHKILQINYLTRGIQQIQHDQLKQKYTCVRTRFIASRLFVCIYCLYHKNHLHNKFRLDIENEQVTCSDCLHKDVISIDMLGRVASILGVYYVLCPVCCKVHVYNGDKNCWLTSCHLSGNNKKPAKKEHFLCDVCKEPYQAPAYDRINHLTGQLEWMAYCSKHHPSEYNINECVNIRQMQGIVIKKQGIHGRYK